MAINYLLFVTRSFNHLSNSIKYMKSFTLPIVKASELRDYFTSDMPLHAENDRTKVLGTKLGYDMDYIPGIDDGEQPERDEYEQYKDQEIQSLNSK